jgi:hypothetical protein
LFARFQADAGETKIDDFGLHSAAGETLDLDVFRLDVAMKDVVLMRCEQALHALVGQFLEVVIGQGTASDHIGQVLALKQFHDNEEALLITGDVEDGDDVGIAQACQGVGLLPEFLLKIRPVIPCFLADGQSFDGNPALQLAVIGTKNRANAASTQLFIDLVTIRHFVIRIFYRRT